MLGWQEKTKLLMVSNKEESLPLLPLHMAWKPYEVAKAFTLLDKAAISVTLLSTCSKKLSDLESFARLPLGWFVDDNSWLKHWN